MDPQGGKAAQSLSKVQKPQLEQAAATSKRKGQAVKPSRPAVEYAIEVLDRQTRYIADRPYEWRKRKRVLIRRLQQVCEFLVQQTTKPKTKRESVKP